MTHPISRRGLLVSSAAAAAGSALPPALFADPTPKAPGADVSLSYQVLPLKLAHTCVGNGVSRVLWY